MRIGIDARILCSPKCGVATYLSHVIERIAASESDVQFYLFAPQPLRDEYASLLSSPRVHRVIDTAGAGKAWETKILPRRLKEHKIDVFHAPFNADMGFFRPPCPTVLTVHDLIPWVVPGLFRNVWKAWRYKLRNYRWTQVAQSVITVSENSRKDIVRLCRVPPEKVRVTHLGIDEEFLAVTPVSETQSVLAKFKVDGKRYVVNIGGFNQPRRNPEFILRGFARYLKETNDDCYLVVTGSILKFAGFYDRVCALIRELGLEERVITTGWVTTPELKVLIENAQVSVITSLYEGFCLPLTESFACGVAVIANDRGSIPEIAAGAAVLVDPFDPAGLALELGLLLKDKKARETWAARGRRRAADFSWERTAAGTWEAYRSVMAGQKTGR